MLSTVYVTLVLSLLINVRYQTSYKKLNIKFLQGEPLGMSLPLLGLFFIILLLPSFLNTYFIVTNFFTNNLINNSSHTLTLDYLFNF